MLETQEKISVAIKETSTSKSGGSLMSIMNFSAANPEIKPQDSNKQIIFMLRGISSRVSDIEKTLQYGSNNSYDIDKDNYTNDRFLSVLDSQIRDLEEAVVSGARSHESCYARYIYLRKKIKDSTGVPISVKNIYIAKLEEIKERIMEMPK